MTIFVEPTNICNFSCTYCVHSFSDYETRAGGLSRLSMSDFGRICDQILLLGRIETLQLYGNGEPFVNRDLPDMIALAKRKDIAERVIVTTNGSLIDWEMAERVVASGLDYLRVSVYGSTQERMTHVTGSRQSLSRIVENVRRVRDLRDRRGLATPFVYVKAIDSGDADENQRFIDLFDGICDETAIEPVHNWNVPGAALSGVNDEELLDRQFFSNRKEICPFPFYMLVVNADLQVGVCCTDWAKQDIIGNLNVDTLTDIWRGERLHQFRLTHLRRERRTLDSCRDCMFLHTATDNMDSAPIP